MFIAKGKIKEIFRLLKKYFTTHDIKKHYILTLDEYKENRTSSQNNLYWKLLNEFAKWGGEDIRVLHNQMLCAYGVVTGKYAIIPENKKIEKMSHKHYMRTSKTIIGKEGNIYQYCRVMKGSHEMNKTEMNNLINGLKNEIIGCGADIDINIKNL